MADVLIVREVLNQCGFPFVLHVATDGEQALSFLEETERDARASVPGLVLLDLNVPKISGKDVLSQLRKNPRWSGVPVVVITSSDSPADRSITEKLGANAYFRKRTNLDAYMQLAGVIRDVLA